MNDVGTPPASAPTRTILVADDDRAIRTVLSQALGRAGRGIKPYPVGAAGAGA
jgi:CheY-like chemotaxis protein